MFCLEKATADWLGDLKHSGSFEESDLEELGSHLEDEIGQLSDHGLSEKEAFWVAMSRVGTRNDLPEEYAKTNSRAVWRHRFWWMAVGVLGYLAFNCLVPFFYLGSALVAACAGIDGIPLLISSLSLMIVVACGALLLAWHFLPKMKTFGNRSRYQRARQSRTGTVVLYVLCIAVAMVLVGLYVYGGLFIPRIVQGDREVTMEAQDAYLVAREVFSLLFAVSLVSIVFVVSRPTKREPHLSLGR